MDGGGSFVRTALRAGRAGDLPAVRALWKTCFGDGDAYIDLFLKDCAGPEDFLLLTEDGKLCAMLCGLPAPVRDADGALHAAVYVYALCSHPDRKGRCLAQRLLSFALDYYDRRGLEAVHLVPAGPSLFPYFARQGFSADLPLRLWMPDAVSDAPGTVVPLTPAQYGALRETLLAGAPHIVPDRRQIIHQKNLSRLGGANLYALHMDGLVACAAAEAADGAFLARELLLPRGLSAAAAAGLLTSRFPGPWRLRLPLSADAGEAAAFGVIRWLGKAGVPGPIHPAFAFD